MRLKNYIFGLMALLAMATSIQQPLFAEKKHSSSSSSNKDDKCCKQSKKLLKQINQTTMQDLVVDQTTLNVVNQINQTTRTDLAVDEETLEIVKHLEDCSCTCTVILPQDFADEEGNLTQTYFITEPGSYCLGADVAFFPLDEFTPAINILANDVRLDLRGFTLSQDPESGTPNAYGVQIGEGYFYNDPDAVLKNITVENGSIINFTAIGVFCYNGSFDGPTAELAFQDLHFFDLNILDCGSAPSFDFASGIDLDSFADLDPNDPDLPVAFSDVIVENCNVNRCVGNGALQFYTVDNLIIRNTQANDLSNPIVVFHTFAHTYYGRNIEMFNCQGNGVQQTDPFSTRQCGGCNIELSANIYLKDCQFNDAFGESSGIVNSNLSLNNNFVVENCQFNNSRGGEFAQVVAGVHGSSALFAFTQGTGIKWINCQFNGASVSPTNPVNVFVTGFLSTCMRNMTFENCQACNMQGADSTFITSGFYNEAFDSDSPSPFFSDADNITYQNCIASDIAGSHNTYGFYVGGGNLDVTGEQLVHNNMVLENCIAERISSTTSTDAVAGIAQNTTEFSEFFPSLVGSLPLQINLYIRDCRISDVRSNADEPSPFSAGILVESIFNPDILNNSVSDCDRGILLTGTNDITPNAFQLAASFEDATAVPPVFINLNTIPAASPVQDFDNVTQSNSVSIAPSSTTIDTARNFIYPAANLTSLGWQPGDEIFYDCNGGNPIADLVCGTTYYAIVYIPGFSKNGLIQNNKVDNCSISCYQDDAPTTLSAWVNNTAFNCGVMPTQFTNYDIDFAGVRPVDAGTLVAYPVGGNKYYNLSLVP